MPPEATIKSIVFDPLNPEIVYAADIQSGVYRSLDRGRTWGVINDGLRTRAVNDLALSSDACICMRQLKGKGSIASISTASPLKRENSLPAQLQRLRRLKRPLKPNQKQPKTPQQPAAPVETAKPGRQGPCSSIALLPLALGWVLMYQKPGKRKG